jgi:DNA repair protein RadD
MTEPPIQLHPFQATVVAEIEKAIASGQKRLLLVAPTGAGKTVIAAEIINRVVERGARVLVLAHRREIITQTRDKLVANGVKPGIVLAGLEDQLRPFAPVQVAGIQTLHARAIRSNRMPMPTATHLVMDETHRARASTYQQLLDLYPDAIIIGLTATPCRGDGRGLGNIFATMIEAPQVAELIDGGHLVRSRVYAPVDPDLKSVQTQQGDYVSDSSNNE